MEEACLYSPTIYIDHVFFCCQDETMLIWYTGKVEKQLRLNQVSRIIPGQRTVSMYLSTSITLYPILKPTSLVLGELPVFEHYQSDISLMLAFYWILDVITGIPPFLLVDLSRLLASYVQEIRSDICGWYCSYVVFPARLSFNDIQDLIRSFSRFPLYMAIDHLIWYVNFHLTSSFA